MLRTGDPPFESALGFNGIFTIFGGEHSANGKHSGLPRFLRSVDS